MARQQENINLGSGSDPADTLAETLVAGNTTDGIDLSFTAGDVITGTGEIRAQTVAGYNIVLDTLADSGDEVELETGAIRGGSTCYGFYLDNNYSRVQAGPTTTDPHWIAIRCHRSNNEISLLGANTGDASTNPVPAEMEIRPGTNGRTTGTHVGADLIISGGAVSNAGNSGAGGSVSVSGGVAAGAGADGSLDLQTSAGPLSFFSGTGSTQPTITGSAGGNAALADLLTKLETMGLIVDSSS